MKGDYDLRKTVEQRTVIEEKGKVTRVKSKRRKSETFPIPKGVKLEEIKGTQEYIEKYFPIVKASSLSLNDEFLKYEPQTEKQTRFKNALTSAIKSGLSDFRAQRMDACLDEEGNICFKVGMKPAVGKSANWWKKNAKDFMPEKESRLGTRKERIGFLGLLIKYLIEEKAYTVGDAWKAVCDQSKDLGHDCDSENAQQDMEDTGSRQVGKWYDLANTCKIIISDEEGVFLLIGGIYYVDGSEYSLADVDSVNNPDCEYLDSLGWLVISV